MALFKRVAWMIANSASFSTLSRVRCPVNHIVQKGAETVQFEISPWPGGNHGGDCPGEAKLGSHRLKKEHGVKDSTGMQWS